MMTATEAAAFARGVCLGDGARRISGVCIDSRKVNKGDLFVALRGEACDGRDFIKAAAQNGAAAAMLSAPSAPAVKNIPQIIVNSAARGLFHLARAWRRKFADSSALQVAAITGSSGKTTIKEMLAAILRAHHNKDDAVCATPGNYNNHLGLPLAMLRLRKHHRAAVFELGMNHGGEIYQLANAARPQTAVLANAQGGHLGNFSSAEYLARAKGEIIAALPASGVAVINQDDANASLWRRICGRRRALWFSLTNKKSADCFAAVDEGGAAVFYVDGKSPIAAKLRVGGVHNIANAAAAALAASNMGANAEAIKQGLESFSGVSGRLQIKRGVGGALLIDDTYNANPSSTRAALAVLAGYKKPKRPGKKVFIFGDMLELGAHSETAHREVGKAAAKAGADYLLACGEYAPLAAAGFNDAVGGGGRKRGIAFADKEKKEEIIKVAREVADEESIILIKGSRGMKMEEVARALCAEKEEEVGL